jgi:hypothetical protein
MSRVKPDSGPIVLTVPPPGATAAEPDELEARVAQIGGDLHRTLQDALAGIPETPRGTLTLARRLGIDKVLASRVLKSIRNPDPLLVVHRVPGPAPLRRIMKSVARQGVDPALVRDAHAAIDSFEEFIRGQVGDRSSLDALLSAWVPEARREFELRRKQSLFKSISHLKGTVAHTVMETVFLYPSSDPQAMDLAWIMGLYDLYRMRPGIAVNCVTRNISANVQPRAPRSIEGTPLAEGGGPQLAEFCSKPLPGIELERQDGVVQYTLADQGVGVRSAVDLVLAETNESAMSRSSSRTTERRPDLFVESSTPAKLLQFDVFIHESLLPKAMPSLRIYDTSFSGVASVNDHTRDKDVYDVLEAIQPLGSDLATWRSSDVPRYVELLRRVLTAGSWEPDAFVGFRCRIDYPIYGSQVTVMFDSLG